MAGIMFHTNLYYFFGFVFNFSNYFLKNMKDSKII